MIEWLNTVSDILFNIFRVFAMSFSLLMIAVLCVALFLLVGSFLVECKKDLKKGPD